MPVTYPLSPAPTQYGQCTWGGSDQPRLGFYDTGSKTVRVKLSKAGATGWTAVDFDENVVASGSLTGVETQLDATVPLFGWFEFRFTGPAQDSLFDVSYSITKVTCVPASANFFANPNGTATWGGSGQGNGGTSSEAASEDFVLKGLIGLTSRLSVTDVTSPTHRANTLTDIQNVAAPYFTTSPAVTDAARPRYLFCAFPKGAVDSLTLPNGSSGAYARAYVKDPTIDATKVFVAIGGSPGNATITVSYPDASTVVETFPGLSSSGAAQVAINLSAPFSSGTPSNYIRVFSAGGGSTNPGSLSATAIGNAFSSGLQAAVASYYANGVTRFEGPSNEPAIDNPGIDAQEAAHQFILFQHDVHAGNASAKAIGPCAVEITQNLTGWRAVFDYWALHSFTPDGISTHMYNAFTHGDLNLGRANLSKWNQLLTDHGLGSVELWQTESTWAELENWGVYHPKRARIPVLMTLLMEQYGIPKERNPPWYDASHGDWTHPAMLRFEDGSCNPHAALYRILTDQVWGQTHNRAISFGPIADDIFVGSIYSGTSKTTAVLLTTSYIPGTTVTFTSSATGPLTVVDSWGNTSTVTADANGRFTVSVREIPTYVQLGAGATLTLYCVGDADGNWPQASTDGQGYDAALQATCKVGSTPTLTPVNGTFLSDYAAQKGIYVSPDALPEAITLTWPGAARGDRIVLFAGSAWQSNSAPLKFTVDTSVDGSAWVTQKLVDVTATAVAKKLGADALNDGCQYRTHYPEQWIFPVKLPAPVTFKALRINVQQTSYGGEVDATTAALNQGTGAGTPSAQHVVVQRVAVLCDDNANVHYATLN